MTSALASDTALGQLPEWNLGDLYAGMDCEELAADIARADNRVSSFQKSWKNSLADLDSNAFQTAIAEYEDIQELLGRIMSYVDLLHASDLSDTSLARFCQTTREQVNDISTGLLFFTIEINEIEDARLEPLLSGPAGRYRRWIETVRAFRPHQLEENQERLLHEKRIAGAGAWTRLFDETLTDLRFDVDDRSMTLEEVLNLLTDRDTDLRRKAAISLGEVLAQNGRVFSLVMNTLAKDKEIEDRWRGFVQPQSSRNLSNQVEDNVVDALNEAVRAAFPDISHRYYRMKASWMHKDVLDHWDRNAPLPEAAAGAISWLEAKDTVLDAYADFSGELADVGRQFFEHDWIDASLREGKASGAFAHPTVPSVHPYLLLNYQGKVRDVMTLAHELGHGVHQVLAAHQGALLSDTPLTLAETASVFGEMLTFRKMLSRETDTLRRKIMLAGKVEDMINTVIRQIAFYNFELRFHNTRRNGELSGEEICDLWIDIQSESLGDAVRLDDTYRWYWAYIPHFIHSPFYVYAYAFGDCLVNSLYAAYETASAGFAEKYLTMLRAGGSLHHRDLLAPFGLDATDPEFWQQGLGVIRGLIEELEDIG